MAMRFPVVLRTLCALLFLLPVLPSPVTPI